MKKHHPRHHPSDKPTDCGSKKHLSCKPTLIGDYFEKLAEAEKKFLKTMQTKAHELDAEAQDMLHKKMGNLQDTLNTIQKEMSEIESLMRDPEASEKTEAELTEKAKSLKKMLRGMSKKRPEPIETKAVKAFLKSYNCSKQKWDKNAQDIHRHLPKED